MSWLVKVIPALSGGPANVRLPPTSILCLSALLTLVACGGGDSSTADLEVAADGRTAPLLDGMGSHHRPIGVDDPMVQRYFDQGLVLAYGFNHAEAARSFREAIRRDPECAPCWWGLGLVLGPNINSVMDPDDLPEALEATARATELAAGAGPAERALIEALGSRYSAEVPEDRSSLDLAYAEAMGEVYRRFPADPDVGTLFAEALMDTTPWDYWREDGEPKPETRELLAALEGVLASDPGHPGANHLLIHAVEARHPERGVEAAERLAEAVPGAGHLVHMPSHIWIRLGRYHDAVAANQRAVAADEAYITSCRRQGLYPLAYMPHNRHFLMVSAAFGGRSELAVGAAREMAALQDPEAMRAEGMGALQHYSVMTLYALVRFGRWEEILDEPEPAADLIYPRGVWHFARGMSMARTGLLEEAKAELAALARHAADPALEAVTVWDLDGTTQLLSIARELLAGEIAAAGGEYETAIERLVAARELEDDLYYDEPPPWMLPVRHYLGRVLLVAVRPAEAEAAFREDLEVFPENGWALAGLERALIAQGKAEEARAVAARLAEAWRHADDDIGAVL